MDPALLSLIAKKAVSECTVECFNLFSWGEPLLHPGIHQLIRIVQDAGIPCNLSSNLNVPINFDAIMAANPACFKISLSGFTQEVYGFSHRGGDIDRVKENMIALAEAKKRNHADTHIFVTYHRYRHNLTEESMMRRFSAALGFDFDPIWALMLPVEKVLNYLDGSDAEFPVTNEDHQLIHKLALPLKESLEASQQQKNQPCLLRQDQISLDHKGNVQLCCGIFDAGRFTLGNYLKMPLAEIQEVRKTHSMCKRCMHHGAHLYLTYRIPGMDNLLLGSISQEDAKSLDLRREFAQKQMERKLQTIYLKYFPWIITKKQKAAIKALLNHVLCLANRSKRLFSGKG